MVPPRLYFEAVPAKDHREMQLRAATALAPGRADPERAAALALAQQPVVGGEGSRTICDDLIVVEPDGKAYINHARAPKLRVSPGAATQLPLHASSASRVKLAIDRINRLALDDCNDPDIAVAWLLDSLELTDVGGRYSRIPFDGRIEQADLHSGDVEPLVACALAAVVHPDDMHKVRGTVIIFTRPEYEKA